MTKIEFEDIYVEYLLGHLEETRAKAFEAHLHECPECLKEISELREALFSLPQALPLSEPPRHLKDAILKAAGGGGSLPDRASYRSGGWRVWAIAASVLVAALGLFAWTQRQANLQLARQVSLLEEENQRLRETNRTLDDRVDLLTRPGTKFLQLAGLDRYEEAKGSAFLEPSGRTALAFLHDLPSLPRERAFQMWVIQEGRPPVPSQVFQAPDRSTEISFNVPIEVDQVAMLAVTIEPTAGSPQPTGPMVLAGRFPESR